MANRKLYRTGRVYKRGKTWVIDYYDPILLKRIRKAVGPKKVDAKAELNEALNRSYKGQAGIEEIEDVSFTIFGDEYLAKYSKPTKTESTYKNEKLVIDVQLKSFFGDTPLSAITAKRIEEFKALRRETVKASTVNRQLDVIKSMMARAVEWGRLATNPAKGVRKFKVDVTAPRFLTLSEGAALIEAAEGQMKGFVVTALNTGLRKSELFRLTWSNVDFERRQILVEQTKGKRFRAIPMNKLLTNTLSRHPHHITSDYVFHNSKGKPWRDTRKSFSATYEKAGLPHVTIHGLRHTFISNLVMAGEDLRTVQELAGHRDINTTMRYAHLAPGHLKASVERLNWDASKGESRMSV
jgi:integrase